MKAYSKEWTEALVAKLKSDDEYQEKAKGFDSTYQFEVKPLPRKGITDTHFFGFDIPDFKEVWSEPRKKTDFNMIGSYETFYKIIRGKLDVMLAIATHSAMVKGDLAKLMAYTPATNRFVEIMGTLQTEFDGDFD